MAFLLIILNSNDLAKNICKLIENEYIEKTNGSQWAKECFAIFTLDKLCLSGYRCLNL